ncbi:class I SAM-dependent methyltransferase [Patescibacteria group bacterium]|nr:class I SAM-dependent methyltransferase [Patescibacteria group bacterium]MBU1663436.1 class I SAM-dependent methyltransferase [Patescibacteria group bacterium]MBU1933640.1 class I SAM-dependent methyltransferase [Patescibacteria group bacterium]MBU2007778.1 class I SAM-dependent methyltransferase [Patescibacteria group bacterium]MBU2233752.1 class I SAM-dependent methyltransferase [Patescibacteria group bacterium]
MPRSIGGSALINVNLLFSQAQVEETMKVADLGCGSSGNFVFSGAKLIGKKGIMYAVDILRVALEMINRRARFENLTNIKTVWSNLEIFGATKIEAGSIDIGLLINTLYQSHKRVEILRESIRLLKKNGKLVIVEWKNTAAPFGPPPEEKVRKELVDNAAKKLGLRLEEEFEAGPYHYGLIYVKL